MTRVPRSFLLMAGGGLVFLYLPVLILLIQSFNSSMMAIEWEGWSFKWYARLWDDRSVLTAALNSVFIGAISTLLSVVFGVGAAIGLENRHRKLVPWFNTVLILPLVIPEILLGVALLITFVLCQIPLGFGTIVLGHVVFNLPLTVIILRARIRKLDRTLEDAARDLGAKPWDILTRITLPLLRPAIWGAALLSFTVSLDDFVVTFFVAGPGSTTLPLKVFSMIKTGVTPEVNALSAIFVMVSMIGVGLSWLFQERANRDGKRLFDQ